MILRPIIELFRVLLLLPKKKYVILLPNKASLRSRSCSHYCYCYLRCGIDSKIHHFHFCSHQQPYQFDQYKNAIATTTTTTTTVSLLPIRRHVILGNERSRSRFFLHFCSADNSAIIISSRIRKEEGRKL